MLERLQLPYDGIYISNAAEEARLTDQIICAYSELGYDIIWVPADTIESRVEFIMSSTNCAVDNTPLNQIFTPLE